jgi:Predicted Fe-S oxidoreductases
MPLPYAHAMSHAVRVNAVATVLRRRDTNSLGADGDLAPYIPEAERVLREEQPLLLPYVEVVLTTRCSLRCRHCSNLMQYYTPETHISYSPETVRRNLARLAEVAGYIGMLRFLGGEPLLCSRLPEIVEDALGHASVGLVEVVSNGTIEPSAELLTVMRHPRASFDFSNYGPVSRLLPGLLRDVKRAGVVYRCVETQTWLDMGGMRRRDYTPERVGEVFRACKNICKTLMGEELHMCPRSAHGTALGLVPRMARDVVNIHEGSVPEVREAIRALYDTDCVEACLYCNSPDERGALPAGEQMPRHATPGV